MWWILPLRSLRLRLLSQFAEPLGAARSEKKCFFTKAKLLGTGVLPLQELKVPTCREGAISAGRRLISHSHAWLECGGAAGFQAVLVLASRSTLCTAARHYMSRTTSEPQSQLATGAPRCPKTQSRKLRGRRCVPASSRHSKTGSTWFMHRSTKDGMGRELNIMPEP